MAISINGNGHIVGRSGETNFNRQMPGYLGRLYNEEADASRPVITYSFLLLTAKIAAFMMVVAAALYWTAGIYGDIVSKGGYSNSLALHTVKVGRDTISVPENTVRFSSQRGKRSLQRLDLYMHWPSMSGYTLAQEHNFKSLEDNAPIIFLSLEPRTSSHEMSGRVASIYEHFFAGPPIEAGHGLLRRPFRKDSAYFSEDLFFEANNPYPYATRCIRVTDKVAEPICMRDIHVGKDLALTYRFHSSLLPEWMAIDRSIRNVAAKMIK